MPTKKRLMQKQRERNQEARGGLVQRKEMGLGDVQRSAATVGNITRQQLKVRGGGQLRDRRRVTEM